MADRFHRLWHDRIVGRHHQNHEIRDLGPPRTHSREGFVPRSVKESQSLVILDHHVVGPDVLSNPAGLSRDYVRLAYDIEERRLSVVHVTHHGHHRCARREFPFRFRFLLQLSQIGLVRFLTYRLETELITDHLDLIEIESLVDRHHQAEVLEGRRDDLLGSRIDQVGQLGNREKLVDADESGLLRLLGLASLSLDLLLGGSGIPAAAALCTSAHGGESLLHALLHGVLIDAAAALAIPLAPLPTVSRISLGFDPDRAARCS